MTSPEPSDSPPSEGRGRRPTARISRYRVELPHAGIVETGRHLFEATEYAERRTGWKGRYLAARDVVVGRTLPNQRLMHERLTKVKALAVFSSDAISSVAYATDEILFVLVLAGSSAVKWSLPIAGAIALLLAIVVASYRQTVRAYPNGGGSYIVAHENLGIFPGLTAAAALLTDYVLTVSVSIAAGVDALASLDGAFRPWAVPLSVILVCAVALVNLRGVRESGTIFAIPTYAFVILLAAAIAVALARALMHGTNPLSASPPETPLPATESLTVLLILKAFASGCAAMTGTEAISNGVQAFKEPASRNARTTLLWMGIILGSLFIGSTVVARHYGFIPNENNTILSQIGQMAFGQGSVLFSALNVMTAAILVLAANTSFADFPRLSAILARDGYMPTAFRTRGNRLVFSVGIVVLALLSCALLVAFDATTTRLIPLYAIGVFAAFTLSQAGMVRRWVRLREAGWRRSALINGVGAVATGVVLLIIIEAKFMEGAWAVLILIPALIGMFWAIGRFYHLLRERLEVPGEAMFDLAPRGQSSTPIVVPVDDINRGALQALTAACESSRDVTAVHISTDPDEPSTLAERWARQLPGVPLVVIDSPYRALSEPLAAWLGDRLREAPHELTVIVPRLATHRWYERLLVNQSLRRLPGFFAGQRRVHFADFAVEVAGSSAPRSVS